MERVFTELEALNIAMEMEKRGITLYRHAARVSTKPEAAQLLSRLERDEREHLDQFAGLYECRLRARDAAARPSEEAHAYLSAVAADVVFPDGLIGMARGVDDPADILRRAMEAERDGIAFYEQMAARAQAEGERAAFLAIAAQEKAHLSALTRMMTEEDA